MFPFGRKKRIINIVIDDYVIRMVESDYRDRHTIKRGAEKLIPEDMINNGKIVDEPSFYQFMKEVVKEWSIKHQPVRFYVPHELIIMREIDIPNDVIIDEVKQYITMEIGNTIHFPFKYPVFDIYHTPYERADDKVTVLAAPEEEIIKYSNIFSDVSLKPIAVDVQALGVYRYFIHQQEVLSEDNVYLMLEVGLLSANISIFHQYQIEFLRHQRMSLSRADWESTEETPIHFTLTKDDSRLQGEIEDLVNELDRLMNFYRFSIHQGAKSITHIIILGDFPYLEQIIERLKQRFDITIELLNVAQSMVNERVNRSFIPALGLALKGGH